ncbi:MAG: lysophospholipid acyltransferase family protein [Flavobacteriaceae bacterium]|nr:lysophospholipid acyltransferase family protein [Flavobacteriaceae bacterium]
MGLVSAREVSKVLGLSRYGFIGDAIGVLLLRLTRIQTINRFYDKNKQLSASAFLDAVIAHFQIDFEIPDEDFKRLPKSGPFITVSNHPLGAIDGVLLLKIMLLHREDYKIMANFLLHRVAPMAPNIFPVNPFENHKDAQNSLKGFKDAMRHLKEGHVLGIFPAGEVSTVKEGQIMVDKAWEIPAMKLIQKAEVPVVPIYFHAKNSALFYRLASWRDLFRTAKLPSELSSQKYRPIKIRIGAPISVAVQKQHLDLASFTDLLRRKTYMLSNAYARESLLDQLPQTLKSAVNLKLPKAPKAIANEVFAPLLVAEIDLLKQANALLLSSRNYEVYLAKANAIPNILQEIGRQREETFRAIGEGTNKSIDLDVFDGYYHHLFLWDNEAQRIVGSYRMGLGSEIFAQKGIDGFYLQDLFRFEPELHELMSQSIEMGRAYIVSDYQQKPMPLFLLWKGIVHTTLRFPEHKYLIGGVSISNQFSNFSKSLMIEFMKSHYWDPYIAQYIRPKKAFKVKLKDADKDFVFDETQADLNKFDKLIDEVEPGNLRLPVLIKKYIKQNARVIAFNVDPLFNNAVDGLMYIKISDLPESTVKPVMEEFQADLERKLAAGVPPEEINLDLP